MEAARFLVDAFGFTVRLSIGDHRVQLHAFGGHVVAMDREPLASATVMVRVPDVRAHCERARAAGARITSEPADHPYGERQYTALDPAGHAWTFSESIADAAPEEWGGTSVDLD